ncbi:MAG: hypothetical protein ACLUD0_02425 [Eubacterium ramulus]
MTVAGVHVPYGDLPIGCHFASKTLPGLIPDNDYISDMWYNVSFLISADFAWKLWISAIMARASSHFFTSRFLPRPENAQPLSGLQRRRSPTTFGFTPAFS